MPETTTSHAKAAVETTRAGAWGAGTFLLGLIASPLPARWRRAIPLLDQSAWREASVPSALLQIVAALTLFGLAYLAWIHGQYDAIDTKAHATEATANLDATDQAIVGHALLGMNPALPIVFALTTLHGFALVVAWLSGGARLLHCAITREAMPDPVLGLIDWGITALRLRRARDARERSKDRSPDKLIVGGPGDPFVLAIETANDFDWREGNTIIVTGQWYRLAKRFETRGPAGLRQRYELEKMPTGVAIRGMRHYDPGHAPVIEASPGSP